MSPRLLQGPQGLLERVETLAVLPAVEFPLSHPSTGKPYKDGKPLGIGLTPSGFKNEWFLCINFLNIDIWDRLLHLSKDTEWVQGYHQFETQKSGWPWWAEPRCSGDGYNSISLEFLHFKTLINNTFMFSKYRWLSTNDFPISVEKNKDRYRSWCSEGQFSFPKLFNGSNSGFWYKCSISISKVF